jgi:hypothetical protein
MHAFYQLLVPASVQSDTDPQHGSLQVCTGHLTQGGCCSRSPALQPCAHSFGKRSEPLAPALFGQSSTSCADTGFSSWRLRSKLQERQQEAQQPMSTLRASAPYVLARCDQSSRVKRRVNKVPPSTQAEHGPLLKHLVVCAGIVPRQPDHQRVRLALMQQLKDELFGLLQLRLVDTLHTLELAVWWKVPTTLLLCTRH